LTDQKLNIIQIIKKAVTRILLWIFLLIAGSGILVIGGLQMPYFQTLLSQSLAEQLSAKIGFEIEINHVHLRWFDTLVLENISIKDQNDSIMIRSDELMVKFKIRSLLNNISRNVDRIILSNGEVNLVKDVETGKINITRFIRELKNLTARKKKNVPPFIVDHILLDNIDFQMNDLTKDSIQDRFDYYHFSIHEIQANISDFQVNSDTVLMEITKFKAVDPIYGLDVDEMNTHFGLSNNFLSLTKLNLKIGKSTIRDSIYFEFDKVYNLSYFVDSVTIKSSLDQSEIYSKDLGLFAPFFKKYSEYYKISGDFKGKITALSIDNLILNFGTYGKIAGDLNFRGLPNIDQTFMDLRLRNSRLHTNDLKRYIPEPVFRHMSKFGNIQFNSQFLGFISDFVADGFFQSDLGTIDSDLNLIIEKNNSVSYEGNLTTTDFNLGEYTNQPEVFQLVDMQGNVNGNGLIIENAKFNLDAIINSIGIRGYDYKNIKTDANFAKELFEGTLSIDDPNLRFNGEATIDIRKGIEEVRINAVLDTMNLRPLNLSEKEASISTLINMDIKGLQIDSLVGKADFKNTYVTYDFRSLKIDSMSIVSLRDNSFRNLDIISSAFDFHANSNIRIANFFKDIQQLLTEYRLDLINNKDSIDAYYAAKPATKVNTKNQLNFDILLKDINPYLKLFTDDLYIGKDSEITGNFIGGYTTIMNIQSVVDTLIYKNQNFWNNIVDISTSKISDSTDILAMAYLYSEKQNFLGDENFNDLQIEGIWDDDRLRFESQIFQEDSDNNAKFKGEVYFRPEWTEIAVNESEFNVIGKKWAFNTDNKIILDDGDFNFDNVILTNKEQTLSINGDLSKDPEKSLFFSINHFQIENLNPLLSKEYFGEINGEVILSDFFDKRRIESEITVDQFKISRFVVGNIVGTSRWDEATKHLLIDYNVTRLDKNTISFKGYISPGDEEEQLNIDARFNKANLNFVEPFIKSYFTKINGLASGDFKISGKLDYPVLKGNGLLEQGHIKINYLNTEYDFKGFIFFDQNEIGVRSLQVEDKNKNITFLNGGIFHDGFTNFVLDISGDMKNFEILNTSSKDNELYYGNAFATGKINMLGALRNLTITANAKSQPGTKIYIPLTQTSNIVQEDFIKFVSRKDSTTNVDNVVDQNPKIDISGLKLNLDLEITPDAYSEIIFDISSGDIIRGRGNGKLKLQIDTKGDFFMFGDYEFQEGGYNFTLSNIINKEFSINEGSRISWYGDPYEGILDMTASYEQLASLAPLMQNLDSAMLASTELRRRYPAIVDLSLKGNLLSPDISYKIRIEDYPNSIIVNGVPFSLETLVSAFDNKLESDEQFLNKQVFSLIILRRFTEDGAFYVSSQTIGSSVSELLSNQLSYWISQVDENLEIDVDLSSFDEDAFNTFQLRLSYTFLEGRLRVTRDGNFTNPDNTTSAESIIGDWTVEYMLTPDGKFRVKMFNKYNYSSFEQSLGNVSSTQTGVSLFYTQSFNDVNSIIKKARKNGDKKDPKVSTDSAIIRQEDEAIPKN